MGLFWSKLTTVTMYANQEVEYKAWDAMRCNAGVGKIEKGQQLEVLVRDKDGKIDSIKGHDTLGGGVEYTVALEDFLSKTPV